MTTRALILTTEPLPLPGLAATGAGLRAWQLEQGLRAAGIDATAMCPCSIAQAAQVRSGTDVKAGAPPLTDDIRARCFSLDKINDIISHDDPDVLVLQHWGLFERLGEVDVPLAIDLAGPHVLERLYWGSPRLAQDMARKVEALRRADFIVCSGRWQRHYFWPYLLQAGWEPERLDIPVIPFCWPPEEPPKQTATKRFVYAGMLLPWQDPSRPLSWLIEEMEKADEGELVFAGGTHPGGDVSGGRFEALLERLESHPRVNVKQRMAFDVFWALLREGGWAVDVMAHNPERELAFATRTVVYLAAGMGLLHSAYTEMAPLIERYDAGVTLPPDDEGAFRNTVRKILEGKYSLEAVCEGAHRLCQEELDNESHIAPLAEWCREPKRRESSGTAGAQDISTGALLDRTRCERDEARVELATLRGKAWVRWGERLIGLRALWAAAGLIVGVLVAPFVFLALMLSGRSKK